MVPERLEDIRQSSSSFALEEGVEEHVVPVVLGGFGDFKTSGDDTNNGKHEAELVDELTTTSADEINAGGVEEAFAPQETEEVG